LKPVFGRIFRFINWDKDLTMEGDAAKAAEEGPPSRAGRVHNYALQIQQIRNMDSGGGEGGIVRKSKSLSDVCEVDERMNEVLRWSRTEAQEFIRVYRDLAMQKQDFHNDEVFLKSHVRQFIDQSMKDSRDLMLEAERHQRYAILVKEAMAKRDQDTLSKYVFRLEEVITQNMINKHALEAEVNHLKSEIVFLRYKNGEEKVAIVDDEADLPIQDAGGSAAGGEAASQGVAPGDEEGGEMEAASVADGGGDAADAGGAEEPDNRAPATSHADLQKSMTEFLNDDD